MQTNKLFLRTLLWGSCALLLSVGQGASAEPVELVELRPYHLEFKADYKFIMPFKGKAERTLNQLEDGSWLLTNDVSSRLIKVKESSRFNWRDNHPQPREYNYSLKGLGAKKHRSNQFDYHSGEVYSSWKKETAEYELIDGLVDRLCVQTALRIDLMNDGKIDSYQVAEKRNPRTLQFEVVGEEVLETALGAFNTVKIKRTRKPDSKRESYFWLAKDWDYLLLKVSHVEKGKSYVIEMSNGVLDGRAITGLSDTRLTTN